MGNGATIDDELAIRARDGGIGLTVEIDRYALVGSTLVQLRRNAALLGPSRCGRVFLAYTDWDLAWSLEPSKPARVDVAAVVCVPSWRPPRSAPFATVEAWRGIAAAIEAHERRHVVFAIEAALRVRRALAAIGVDSTAIDGLVRAAADREVDQVREDERRFDEVTAHGARDGVSWPRSPARAANVE